MVHTCLFFFIFVFVCVRVCVCLLAGLKLCFSSQAKYHEDVERTRGRGCSPGLESSTTYKEVKGQVLESSKKSES